MKVEIPSSCKPFALATRFVMVRVVPSVPSNPHTVVTPPVVISVSVISGVLVLGPPSPPPPRI